MKKLQHFLGSLFGVAIIAAVIAITFCSVPVLSQSNSTGITTWQANQNFINTLVSTVISSIQYAGDVTGTVVGNKSTLTVVSTHLTAPLPIAQGGTGIGAPMNYNVLAYGAKCDGSTNDSAAFTAAVAAAAAGSGTRGGTVIVPPSVICKADFIMNKGVTLEGPGGGVNGGFNSFPCSSYIVDASGGTTPVITIGTGTSDSLNNTIEGICIKGTGTGAGDMGVLAPAANHAEYLTIRNTTFINFAQEGMRLEFVESGTINNNKTINTDLAAASLATHDGALYLGGTDNFVFQNELSGPNIGLSSINAYLAALYATGGNNFITDNVLEFADEGLHTETTESLSQVVGNRADHNFGNQFSFNGSGNRIIGNEAIAFNVATANTYQGFFLNGANSVISGNIVDKISGNAFQYAFDDTSTGGVDGNYDVLMGNRILGTPWATASYKLASGASTAHVSFGGATDQVFGAGTATPNVDQETVGVIGNVSPQSVTNFVNGLSGQCIDVLGDDNTTITNSLSAGGIRAATGQNELLVLDTLHRFCNFQGKWREVSPYVIKQGTVTTGAITATTYADVTLTWPTAFTSAAYTPTCSVLDSTSAAVGLSIDHIQAINAGTLVVTVHNGSAGTLTGTLNCTGIRNQ